MGQSRVNFQQSIQTSSIFKSVFITISLVSGLLGMPDNLTFFPHEVWFKPLLLDPSAAQSSASLLRFQLKNDVNPKVYSPVNLGFQKMLLHLQTGPEKGWEAGIEFGIHSQFSIVSTPDAPMGGLDNTDYIIAGVVHYKHGRTIERVNLFHQSSHLGDDYLIRNNIVDPNNRAQNYEQISFTRAIQYAKTRWYYGAGLNISPNTVRKRTLLQTGVEYQVPWQGSKTVEFICGGDVKFYEQNDFRPNVKLGAGIRFTNDTLSNMTFLLEFYDGHLPYSTLEDELVNWVGIGVYFQPVF